MFGKTMDNLKYKENKLPYFLNKLNKIKQYVIK